jgi:hypothetical protein
VLPVGVYGLSPTTVTKLSVSLCVFIAPFHSDAAVEEQRCYRNDNVSSPTNVEPSTLLNAMGFGQLSTDATQWYFFYGGSIAQTLFLWVQH